MTIISLEIPDKLYQQLQRQALLSRQSVDEFARATLSRFLPAMVEVEADLPPVLQVELKAMEQLSDAALWSLARGQMTSQEQAELVKLDEVQQQRDLMVVERQRQNELLTLYDEMLLRRAHAALLLQSRGHDLSDTSLLQNS